MNYKMISFVLMRVLALLGVLFVFPFVTALLYHEENCARIFLVFALLCGLTGALHSRQRPENPVFYAREGFVMTVLSWIMISMIGALPFVLAGTIPSYVDAVFETVSGFTTTGASILSGDAIDRMYKSVEFWRCFTHWGGGMGILVFMIAILPRTDGYSMYLMKAESPGPTVGKFVPKVQDTAKILYLIYMGFTLTEIVLLKICGLPLFDAMTLTFSSVGTGGFSISSAGIMPYSIPAQVVIIVFMTICGTNFAVYYALTRRRFKEAIRCEEAKWYLMAMFGSAALIAWNVHRAGLVKSPFLAFHHALFTVSSIMTTTGFATLDFNTWPAFSKALLFVLTLIGACAGSTGGGFKYSRLIILLRRVRNELDFSIHPKCIKQVYMDGRRVESTTVKGVLTYLVIYTAIFLLSFLLISLDGKDFETNMSAIAATINNVGPGLGLVGPAGNFGSYSDFSKLVMTFDMLAGRLEFIPVLVLLRRSTWRS